MRAIFISVIVIGLCGCDLGSATVQSETSRWSMREPVLDRTRSADVDILAAAAAYPDRTLRFRDSTGAMATATYGDPLLDDAVLALPEIQRPWTFRKIRGAYASEADVGRRTHLIRALAASRDPRAAILLHEVLTDERLDIRIAALKGLWDHFIAHDGAWAGGTEQMFFDEARWWKEHETQLREAAEALEVSPVPLGEDPP